MTNSRQKATQKKSKRKFNRTLSANQLQSHALDTRPLCPEVLRLENFQPLSRIEKPKDLAVEKMENLKLGTLKR